MLGASGERCNLLYVQTSVQSTRNQVRFRSCHSATGQFNLRLNNLTMDARSPLFARMEGDRKIHDDYDGMNDLSDVDFGLTINESGRGVFEPSDDDDTLDGLDFSALAPGSGRPLDTTDGTGRLDSARSAALDAHSTLGLSKDRSFSLDSQSSNFTSQSPERKQQSFQPLLPLPEHPTIQRSAPRAIPKPPQSHNQPVVSNHPSSQPSSAGSTASAFLNNLLDPAASTFNNTHMSHTPPNHIATSYEASHFGKRARSGVSTLFAPKAYPVLPGLTH